ncbi:MAG: ankyrin repeat domain-containing protein [Treponema sp.]|nr:ankyrin repeat domain-containing protein [Treponema sp.]
MCAAVLAAVVGIAGVQSAAAETEAEAVSKSRRPEIDGCLELYEEGIKQIEAGNELESQGTIWAATSGLSQVMKYKEWTKADSDRLAALTDRFNAAYYGKGVWAMMKKRLEEPYASQELLDAIQRDDAAAVKKLIAQGEDPNTVIMGTPTPVLWEAAKQNKPKAARALIESGADVLFKFKSNNATVLHQAAFYGGRELLTVLLDAGAKKYVNEVSGQTPAMVAASIVNLEALKVLMAYGADLNKKVEDSNGVPIGILMCVYDRVTSEAAGRLADSGDIKAATKKWEQGKKNEADFLSFLIKSGVNKKADLSAALFNYWSNPAAMKILIDAGADVNRVTDESERTLLFEAIYGAYMSEEGFKTGGGIHGTPYVIESIRLLIASGANVNARDEHGNTPLHQASMSFRGFTDLPEIIHILLDAGVNVDARNNEGKTPLMRAASCNAAENAKALLAAGADVNAKDKGGYTPLWYATTRGNYGRGKVEAVLRAHGGVGADTSFKGE